MGEQSSETGSGYREWPERGQPIVFWAKPDSYEYVEDNPARLREWEDKMAELVGFKPERAHDAVGGLAATVLLRHETRRPPEPLRLRRAAGGRLRNDVGPPGDEPRLHPWPQEPGPVVFMFPPEEYEVVAPEDFDEWERLLTEFTGMKVKGGVGKADWQGHQLPTISWCGPGKTNACDCDMLSPVSGVAPDGKRLHRDRHCGR